MRIQTIQTIGYAAGLLDVAGLTPQAQAAPGAVAPSFSLRAASGRTLSPSARTAANRMETPGKVSANRKTLTFGQKTVRLVVYSGPDSDMLSYRIAGLRNPTLVVPAGALLKVLFVNEDGDMTHNLRFGVQKPPFAPAPDHYQTVGTPELAPVSKETRHAEELLLRAPSGPGTYYYLCTVPGHARGGMFGAIVTK